MQNCLSRIERLSAKIEELAGRGKWSFQTTLYSSEIKRIEHQWKVNVQVLKSENNHVDCLISWSNAFPNGLNYKQAWYVSKLIYEMPEAENYAQRLYMIAARA